MAIVTTLAVLELARRLDAYTAGMLRVPMAVLAATALAWWFLLRVPPSNSLRGRRVLITGAAHGLGEELALQAASRGATLVLWDIDGEALAGVVARAREALRATGHPVGEADARAVLGKAFDISDEGALCAARDEALRVGMDIDSVISGAAILQGGVRAAALTGAQLARTLAVNLGGPLALLRNLLPHLSAGLAKAPEARRTLCFVSSLMGTGMGAQGLADYTASKAGLNAAVECLRQEVNAEEALSGRLGVHLVCPWVLDTDMFKGAFTSKRAPLLERCFLRAVPPLRRGAVAAHILDGLAFRHGAHWVTFRPFFMRFAAYLPRLLLAPSVGLYDALMGAIGGARGMELWQGSEWNRRQCSSSSSSSGGVGAGGGRAAGGAAAVLAAAAPSAGAAAAGEADAAAQAEPSEK